MRAIALKRTRQISKRLLFVVCNIGVFFRTHLWSSRPRQVAPRRPRFGV
jgi:hypothetical protein